MLSAQRVLLLLSIPSDGIGISDLRCLGMVVSLSGTWLVPFPKTAARVLNEIQTWVCGV